MVQMGKRNRVELLLCPPIDPSPRWRVHFVNSFLPFDAIYAAVRADLNLFDQSLFEPIFPTTLLSIAFLSFSSLLFSPFSYTFDLLVKTAIEQGVIFRRDQYLLSSHSLLFSSSRVSLFWYCSGAIDTGTVDTFLDLIVERVSANLLTIAPL